MHTLTKSTNPIQALRADTPKEDLTGRPLLFAAFMIHLVDWAGMLISSFSSVFEWPLVGNSCILPRKSEASSCGTENASAVSCEIGCKGLPVVGRSCTESFSLANTSVGKGAFRGGMFDRESGNTKVMSTVF